MFRVNLRGAERRGRGLGWRRRLFHHFLPFQVKIPVIAPKFRWIESAVKEPVRLWQSYRFERRLRAAIPGFVQASGYSQITRR